MSIQFIAEDKSTHRIKVLKNISDFTQEDFDKYTVYSTSVVSGEDFDKFKVQLQVRALQEQSKAMMEQQQKIATQLAELTGTNVKQVPVMVPTSQTESVVTTVNTGTETQIMNSKTKQFFTKAELWEEYLKFKDALERSVPEVTMVEFDLTGFTVLVTEYVPNIPKILPIGIPVKQREE